MGSLSRAWVVACLVLVTACDGSPVEQLFDAPPPIDAAGCVRGNFSLCNPLGAPGSQGCGAGQMCTAIVELDPSGALCPIWGCVPEGHLGHGEACTRPEVGWDDCMAGLVCADGTCRDICGFDGSAGAACAVGFSCVKYEDLFVTSPGNEPTAGACQPACNPIDQRNAKGEPCPEGQGCYLLTSGTETKAACAQAGTVAVGETIVGPAFANSCVPGAQPRRRDQTSMAIECGGLCRPADVTSTMNQTDEAGIAPDDCVTRWGAAPPDDATAGESCRYWWAREPFEGLSPYSNAIGFCFKHSIFRYDSDGDGTDDRPLPRCAQLTTGDVEPPIGNPTHDDAIYFWCNALPQDVARPPSYTPLHLDRLRPP